MMTLAQPIAIARGILNDTDAAAYRYSDADLLRYANDALDQLVVLAPQLFHTEGEVQCVGGKTVQAVGFGDAQSLVSVRRVKNGNAVTPTDRATLDAFNPGWHNGTAAAAIHWMPIDNNPVGFLIYPPPPLGQVLEVTYVRIPPEYGVNDVTELPTTLEDPVADYIVARAEGRDDEHVNSQRAAMFAGSFVAKIKGA